MVEIRNRYTSEILFSAPDVSNLNEANLNGADLYEANLCGANLYRANLRGADLRGANLNEANLNEANLYEANLYRADLRDANLYRVNLRRADLREADLCGADLREANLYEADLCKADLREAKNIPALIAAQLSIIPEGDIIGWKKCESGEIVKLRIPAAAKRSNATGRKCRAEYAGVLEIWSSKGQRVGKAVSIRGGRYVVGKFIHPDDWDGDRWNECSYGIHFFLTREEAEAY